MQAQTRDDWRLWGVAGVLVGFATVVNVRGIFAVGGFLIALLFGMDSRMFGVDVSTGEPLCGPLLLSPRSAMDQRYPDARSVASEVDSPMKLWQMPTP